MKDKKNRKIHYLISDDKASHMQIMNPLHEYMHAGNRINQYETFLPLQKFYPIKEKNEMKFCKED